MTIGLPDFPVTTYDTMLPVSFEVPPVNPSPTGLYAVTQWPGGEADERLPGARVIVRGANYGGSSAFGIWGAGWCGLVVTITVDADDGTFDVLVDGQPATVAHDVSAGDLQTALLGLSVLDIGDVRVAAPEAGTYTLVFTRRHEVDVDGGDLTGTGHSISLTAETKTGERPAILDPFEPVTAWATDECDLTEPSRAEVEARAAQILRLEEPVAVEREFAARLLLDVAELPGSIDTVADFVLAIGYLEAQLALTNTLGFIHLGAQWAAVAANSQILGKSGTKLVSPLGHTYVFGGGYVDGLEDTLVATSQPFGWRDQVQLRTAIDTEHNTFVAVAERTVLVGYEAIISAVTIS